MCLVNDCHSHGDACGKNNFHLKEQVEVEVHGQIGHVGHVDFRLFLYIKDLFVKSKLPACLCLRAGNKLYTTFKIKKSLRL